VTTSGDFSNFLSQLMTFHDHVMTFVMSGEDLWTTLSIPGDKLLMILMAIVEIC
jgi:hypothetical protein